MSKKKIVAMWKYENQLFPVVITGAVKQFGRTDYKIVPEGGSGERRVQEDQLIFNYEESSDKITRGY